MTHAKKCHNADSINTVDSCTQCDGYHTWDELYEHRHFLYLNLAQLTANFEPDDVWRSKLHADGTMDEGWFILGMGKEPGKQISYHLPLRLWKHSQFATTLDRAPEWDGHTPDDVIQRLRKEVEWIQEEKEK